MKLIAVGDNVTDTYIDQKIYYPGGNCVNVAVDAKKAGADQAAYLGIFGDDERADHIRNSLVSENVDLVNCRKAYASTARPEVHIGSDGDRIFRSGPKDSVAHRFSLQLTRDDLEKIANFDVAHISLYSGLEKNLAELKGKTKISFDFSDCQQAVFLEETLPQVDYAFFSGSDLSNSKVEKLAQKYLAFGPEVVAITRGPKEAFLLTAKEACYQKPRNISVVDTMGAGDSFIAGFLVSYLNNHNLSKAASAGSCSAAATCQLDGGFGHGKAY